MFQVFLRRLAEARPMLLRRISVALPVLTFVLLLVGGLVHATGSSLACPDWPLCYGQVFPKMEGGILVEHSHRLLATFVGVCTIALLAAGFSNKRVRPVASVALGLVIFQGVLGGVTVLLKIQPLVSTAHLATSMIFFATGLYLAFQVHSAAAAPSVLSSERARQLARGSVITLALVYFQIVLGAFVRHSGSGLACGDNAVLCGSALSGAFGPAHLQMFHRLMALIVAAKVIFMNVRTGRAAVRGSTLQIVSRALIGLVLLQIGLGMLSVWSLLGVAQVTAHLGVAALIWAGSLWSYWLLRASVRTGARVENSDSLPQASALSA